MSVASVTMFVTLHERCGAVPGYLHAPHPWQIRSAEICHARRRDLMGHGGIVLPHPTVTL